MAEWGAKLRAGCGRFESGHFNPSSQEDARSVLSGEALKRLESFVFELLFQRRLSELCGDVPKAFGWYVVSKDENSPLWIKLESEPLNSCDEKVIELLNSRECRILKARFDEGLHQFRGSWYFAGAWREETELSPLLEAEYGSPNRVRGPDEGESLRVEQALVELFSRLTESETCALVLGRMLINCYLVPFLRTQPMDIDAIVLNSAGTLHFLEFKRKYPTQALTFGLDTTPHAALAMWLQSGGNTLSNIILCDPLWNKEASPNHLLGESKTRSYAYWLGIHLTPELTMRPGSLKTKGADSGMYGQARTQISIPVERYSLLGRQFNPAGLREFIEDRPLGSITRKQLLEARDDARKALAGVSV